jgi:hypothetical protein
MLSDCRYAPLRTFQILTVLSSDAEASCVESREKVTEQSLHLSKSLSSDCMWTKHAGNNILWVPSEYRPSCLSVRVAMIGLCVGCGREWFCSINAQDLRQSQVVARVYLFIENYSSHRIGVSVLMSTPNLRAGTSRSVLLTMLSHVLSVPSIDSSIIPLVGLRKCML